MIARSLRRIASIFFLAATIPLSRAANEAAFLDLWNFHAKSPGKNAEVIEKCRAFVRDNPNDPYQEPARSIEAWHLLASGQGKEAWAIFESQANNSSSPEKAGAALVAKGWLTRRDRDHVAAALKVFYRSEITYPANLEDLQNHKKIPAEDRPPSVDRFGEPWDYRQEGFAKLKGFEGQKYHLQSQRLGLLSDLSASLRIPYADQLKVKATQILPGDASGPIVQFENIGSKGVSMLGLGKASKQFHLAHVGDKFILVCDTAHWKVIPKP
ncbi:MAG: tetratricopeptide repeat protein [Terrimicrobiaceae bacterium]